ncbi:MAG: hypothetical protein M3032_04365, partial [Verrucomicrobiota bacterium]|nr:hypothetical protein [Verrucomicrobiota bacterium]
WFSSPTSLPEMLAMFFFAGWAVARIARTDSPKAKLAASAVLVFALLQFVFCCYPAFQVPLLYLAGFLCVGVALHLRRIPLRGIATLAAALLVTAAVLAFWVADVGDVLRQIRNQVYPGKVVLGGGGFAWANFAAPFLEFGMNDDKYPIPLGNSSEGSGFLFLLPVIVALAARDIVRRRYDPIFLASTIFLVLLALFMIFGLPTVVAERLLLSRVSGYRAAIALGVGSAIALCRYFARRENSEPPRKSDLPILAALTALLLISLHIANAQLRNYVGVTTVIAASVYFAATFLLLWKHRVASACVLLLAPLVYVNALVNPVERGLPGFRDSRLIREVSKLRKGSPEGPWLVLGRSDRSNMMAQFLKAAGVPVLGGVQVTPPPWLERLDPEHRNEQIYNRYAHIGFIPETGGDLRFERTATQSYDIHVGRSNDALARLGATYVLEVDPPPDETELAGFEPITAFDGFRILRALPAP